jgi:hypothetical protein
MQNNNCLGVGAGVLAQPFDPDNDEGAPSFPAFFAGRVGGAASGPGSAARVLKSIGWPRRIPSLGRFERFQVYSLARSRHGYLINRTYHVLPTLTERSLDTTMGWE